MSPAQPEWRYLIALGSNVPHAFHGRPRAVIAAALAQLPEESVRVLRAARTIVTDPLGPSIRRYANTAAVIETRLPPEELLRSLKRLERAFGRRPGGRRWRARVLDLDIILWSGGSFAAPELIIPHKLFRERTFVLQPAAQLAPDWRDPVTGLTLRQLHAQLTAPRPLPKRAAANAREAGP